MVVEKNQFRNGDSADTLHKFCQLRAIVVLSPMGVAVDLGLGLIW